MFDVGRFFERHDAPSAVGATFLTGINDRGQIIGLANNSNEGGFQGGFLYSNGVFTTLNVPIPGAFATERTQSTAARDIKAFEVKVTFDQPPPTLKPGMTADVTFPVGAKEPSGKP